MKIELDRKGKEAITILIYTTNLSIKTLSEKFKIPVNELNTLKKHFNTQNIDLEDFVIGALNSQSKSTVEQIAEFIEWKNNYPEQLPDLLNTLNALKESGRTFQLDERWSLSERIIECYDNSTELLIKELPLASFDLNVAISNCNTSTDDPLMFNPYELTDENYRFLEGAVNCEFDFKNCSYYLATVQNEKESNI